jgi:hypothetical protein
VQVGFAGKRQLFDPPPENPDVERQWLDTVKQYLVEQLQELPSRLNLSDHHFLCGISQIACGADVLFARACRDHAPPIPQRIFLPEPLDDYLSATEPDGTPDFTPDQRTEAEALLASPHVIHVRVVSQAGDRTDRFRETNAEILRVSDVIVCLLREDGEGQGGGTKELLDRALAVGKPVLEIRVAVKDAQPVCRNVWHVPPQFQPPAIPDPISQLSLPEGAGKVPDIKQYLVPLHEYVDTLALDKQRRFLRLAAKIITMHVLATLLATAVLALHGHGTAHPTAEAAEVSQTSEAAPADGNEPAAAEIAPESEEPAGGEAEVEAHALAAGDLLIPLLLIGELVLLAIGFRAHRRLHHSQEVRNWANARVVAELARSIDAVYPRHVYLEYLFRLSLPHRFRPLSRTLSVLHLRSTRERRNDPWQPLRAKYLDDRIGHQITYYTTKLADDESRLWWCRGTFFVCSTLAMAATAVKLIMLVAAALFDREFAAWPQGLGIAAVLLPVLAVAALSWAAARDCEARVETFKETLDFLKRQKEQMPHVDSGPEFNRMVLATETVLLGEVTNWFSRRSNTSVT